MILRIGHLSTFYHTAILLMPGGPLNGSLGVEAEWRLFGTGPAIVDAFSRAEIDLAYIGLPPAIVGMDRGVDICCVAGGHMEGTVFSGLKGSLRFSQKEGLEPLLEQFSGQRLGVPGKGSIHDVILSDCLDRFSLRDRIEVVNYPWADSILEAFIRGELSGTFGTPALAVGLRRFARADVVCPPDRLWPDNPSYGIVVSRSFMREHADLLTRFLEAHESATAFLRKDPQRAAQAISDCVKVVDESFVLETLLMSPKYCGRITPAYISSTMKFVEAMVRLGYIKKVLNPNEIFDIGPMDQVHGPGDHYRNMINMCRIQPLFRL